MITLLVAGLLLITVGAGGTARADDGCCGGQCGGTGAFAHAKPVPNITWYATYPFWWPQYFGPPHTDYQVVQYVTSPAESAAIVKERILAINAGNPALLTMPKEPLPYPKSAPKEEPGKLPK